MPVFDSQEHGEPVEGVQNKTQLWKLPQAADLGRVDGGPGSKQEAREAMRREVAQPQSQDR